MKLIQACNMFYKLANKHMIKTADEEALIARALVKLITDVAKDIGIDDHAYIVGGSVRDFVMGVDPKDIDIVVETHKDPDTGEVRNAVTLAKAVADKLNIPNIQADQYGVVHIGPVPNDFIYEGLNLKGQKIEIVTARKEQYDKGAGKASHKPTSVEPGTIEEDLKRRDFTFNTMTWKLSDLGDGLEGAPIGDTLGGRQDLDNKLVRTPIDPIETFTEDPSRMLRAVRFAVKYGFDLDGSTKEAIKQVANEVKRMPVEPIGDILVNKIFKLGTDKSKTAIVMMDELNLLKPVLEMIDKSYVQRQLKNLPAGNDASFIMFLTGYLNKYNIQNFIYKFPRMFEGKLMKAQGALSQEQFQLLYDRLLEPAPIDVAPFIEKFNFKGKDIGSLVTLAREFIIKEPDISREDLMKRLMEHFGKLHLGS